MAAFESVKDKHTLATRAVDAAWAHLEPLFRSKVQSFGKDTRSKEKAASTKVAFHYLLAGAPVSTQDCNSLSTVIRDELQKGFASAFGTTAQSFEKRVEVMLTALTPARETRKTAVQACYASLRSSLGGDLVFGLCRFRTDMMEKWDTLCTTGIARRMGGASGVDFVECSDKKEIVALATMVNTAMQKVSEGGDVLTNADLVDAELAFLGAYDKRTDLDRSFRAGYRIGAGLVVRRVCDGKAWHVEALGGRGLAQELVWHALEEATKAHVHFITLDAFTDHAAKLGAPISAQYAKTTTFWRDSIMFHTITEQDVLAILMALYPDVNPVKAREVAETRVQKALKAKGPKGESSLEKLVKLVKTHLGLKAECARLLPMVKFLRS